MTVKSFAFFLNDPATTEIYTLSLHDALPILSHPHPGIRRTPAAHAATSRAGRQAQTRSQGAVRPADRKSTRLNSSHTVISYAVFCLKKKNKNIDGQSSTAFPSFQSAGPLCLE